MLWQRSPQYANMPHEQYMQTPEGRQYQESARRWEQWQRANAPTPSKPGPSRPSVPMQPQGMTPSKPAVPMPQYGQPGGMTPSKPGPGRPSVPMAPSYSPGQAKPQQSPYATSTPYGQQPPSQQPNRPPPFLATTQNFDGTQSQMPNFQQRDAFIAQINNQLGQMQQQSWQRPGMGAPQFNFPQMWGQAGQMAEQGFRNPFAAPAGRLVSQAALADIAPEHVGRPLPPLPPGAVY